MILQGDPIGPVSGINMCVCDLWNCAGCLGALKAFAMCVPFGMQFVEKLEATISGNRYSVIKWVKEPFLKGAALHMCDDSPSLFSHSALLITSRGLRILPKYSKMVPDDSRVGQTNVDFIFRNVVKSCL